jgi:glycosyltransferase involved in cell wall biosynthesis
MNFLRQFALNAKPLVSVVVASYNHQDYVQACLQSVLSQDFQDFEIVITDDGSSDETVANIQAIQDKRIHLKVLPQNSGACIALNDAILRARGKFVAVLNSDDFFLPGKLSLQVSYLQSHPQVGAVFGLPCFVNEQGQEIVDPAHRDSGAFKVAEKTRHQWLRYFFDEGNALCHPTVLIRRCLYQQLGLYDPRLAQVPDLDMWIRLATSTQIRVLAKPLTAFRVRDGLMNASAGRPEVIVRDAWERARILRHYAAMPEHELGLIFPEFLPRSEPLAVQLARYALDKPYPFFHRFALDLWFESLPSAVKTRGWLNLQRESPQAWQEFINKTGQTDLHKIYSKE